MNYRELQCIFEMIHWDKSEEEQQKGIECAAGITDLQAFFQPGIDKSIWKNCALILVRHSDCELKPYFRELFQWCMDMNWPGAEIIYDRLLQMEDLEYKSALEKAIEEAIHKKDDVWLKYLLNLKNKKAFWN